MLVQQAEVVASNACTAVKLEAGTVAMLAVTSAARCLQARLPESERYFGLENFGNTCYANSVLQVQTIVVVFGWCRPGPIDQSSLLPLTAPALCLHARAG